MQTKYARGPRFELARNGGQEQRARCGKEQQLRQDCRQREFRERRREGRVVKGEGETEQCGRVSHAARRQQTTIFGTERRARRPRGCLQPAARERGHARQEEWGTCGQTLRQVLFSMARRGARKSLHFTAWHHCSAISASESAFRHATPLKRPGIHSSPCTLTF